MMCMYVAIVMSGGISSYDSGSVRWGPGLIVRGTHYLQVRRPDQAMQYVRHLADHIFSSVIPAFGSVNSLPTNTNTQQQQQQQQQQSVNDYTIPENVALMTLQAQSDGSVLLRLSHQFAVGEDEELSTPAVVNVNALMRSYGLHVTACEELSLTGNQNANDVERLVWKTEDGVTDTVPLREQYVQNDPEVGEVLLIVLQPMQIRTFQLEVKYL